MIQKDVFHWGRKPFLINRWMSHTYYIARKMLFFNFDLWFKFVTDSHEISNTFFRHLHRHADLTLTPSKRPKILLNVQSRFFCFYSLHTLYIICSFLRLIINGRIACRKLATKLILFNFSFIWKIPYLIHFTKKSADKYQIMTIKSET